MKKSVQNKLFVGLASAVAAVVGHASYAEDAGAPASAVGQTTPAPAVAAPAPAQTSPTPADPTASSVVTGKIVVLDKVARTITLQVGEKLQLLTVGANVKMVSQGRLVGFDDLAVGQEVSVLIKETGHGHLQVVALRVELSKAPVEPAGVTGVTGGGSTQARGRRPADAPFATLPNPANNLGPVISPAR